MSAHDAHDLDGFDQRYERDRLRAAPRLALLGGLWSYATRSQYPHHDWRHDEAAAWCHRRNEAEGRYRRFWGRFA